MILLFSCENQSSETSTDTSSSSVSQSLPEPTKTTKGTLTFNYNPSCLFTKDKIYDLTTQTFKNQDSSNNNENSQSSSSSSSDPSSIGYPSTTSVGDTTSSSDTTTDTSNQNSQNTDNQEKCNNQITQLEKCNEHDQYINKKFKSNKVLDTRDRNFCDSFGDYPTDIGLSYETELLVFDTALRNNECWLLVESQQIVDGYKPDFYVRLNSVKEFLDNNQNNQETNQETQTPEIENLKAEYKEGKIILTWDTNPEAQYYIIYKNGVKQLNLESTTYEDTEITSNTEYTYSVSTYNETYDIKESKNKTITIKTPEITQTKPVENFKAEYKEGEIKLTWDINPEAEYYIIKKNDILLANITINNYNDSDIELDVEYNYTIYAYNSTKDIKESKPVSIKIKIDLIKINAFDKKSFTDNTIELQWSFDGYPDEILLYRNDDLILNDSTKTKYIDENLEKDKCYNYTLIIRKNTIEDKKQDEFCTNSEIQDITQFKKLYSTDNTIYLIWDAKYPYGSFKLYRSETENFNTAPLIYEGKDLNYLDQNLQKDKIYYYKLTLSRKDKSDTEIIYASTSNDFTYIKDFKAVLDNNKVKITWQVYGDCKELTLLKNRNLLHKTNDCQLTSFEDTQPGKGTFTYELLAIGNTKFAQALYDLTIP
ncbi:MAG: hypothetical protein QW757_05185 [Candidatus Woesearchaeota archaeon]